MGQSNAEQSRFRAELPHGHRCIRVVVKVVLPAHPVGAEAGGVRAVMTGRPPAAVVGGVEIAAGVVITRVRELEIETFVGAHGGHHLRRGAGEHAARASADTPIVALSAPSVPTQRRWGALLAP